MSVKVTKRGNAAAFLGDRLAQLKKSEVLVGIPASTTLRKNEPINNSSLLWLHSQGSPLRNLPARPVLEPAIEQNRAIIAPHLGAAAKAILDNDPAKAEQELETAGVIAANGAKRYVLQGNNLAPNAPSTIKAKKSDRPLVDTGSMVRAITSVVRTKT